MRKKSSTKSPSDDPDLRSHTTSAADPEKKRILEELEKKYRGEEGERAAILPLIEWLSDSSATNRDATMILGQKSSLDLVEQSMEDELAADVFPEPIDKKIAIVEKVAEAVGLKLDIQAIEAEVLQNILMNQCSIDLVSN